MKFMDKLIYLSIRPDGDVPGLFFAAVIPEAFVAERAAWAFRQPARHRFNWRREAERLYALIA